MTSSNLHIMGFKPPMQYDDPLHKIFLAHQITEDAGLNIEYGSIHYIIGNVWNTLTHNFEPGPGANIIINENITQDDINHINNAHRKDHLSGLIFLLGHKYKSDYNNNNWYRNDIENTIAFDRFTIPNSLTNTPKVNAKPINCMPPTMRSTLLSNKNTSPHPENNNKLIKKSGKIFGDETLYSPLQTQEKPHYIPSSERHTCTPTAHKSHRRKFKCNILNNLNKKIQQNIKYNQNINAITSIKTPTILPENPNIINKSIAPFTQLHQHPHTDPPKDLSTDPNAASSPLRTVPNGNNNADNAALNKKLNDAVMRALTHYKSSLYLSFYDTEIVPTHTKPASSPPHLLGASYDAKTSKLVNVYKISIGQSYDEFLSNDVNKLIETKNELIISNNDTIISMPSIKSTLTANNYVLNDKNTVESNGVLIILLQLILMAYVNIIKLQ